MQARIAIALLKNRQVQTVLLIAALMVVMLPVLVAAGVAGLFSQEAESACGGAGSVGRSISRRAAGRCPKDCMRRPGTGAGALV